MLTALASFNFIKTTILPDKIIIFPLGFFHFHLNYNPILDKFFGVCHIKFEISHELGYEHMHPNGYLKKKVMYNGIPSTEVDLTIGSKEENFLQHNYIFSVSSNNLFELYKINCNLRNETISGTSLNILGENKLGISDNFFNTTRFADINYYNDTSIGVIKDYILIAQTIPKASDINTAGGNQTFFAKNIQFTCKPLIAPKIVAPTNPYQDGIDQLGEFGLADRIDDYIVLRTSGMSHEDAISSLFG